MLKVKSLGASIPKQALSVDINLGLIFTLGQYGDAALDGPRVGLESDDCVMRDNAVLAIGHLLPTAEPPGSGRLTKDDPCEATREQACQSLGLFDIAGALALAV